MNLYLNYIKPYSLFYHTIKGNSYTILTKNILRDNKMFSSYLTDQSRTDSVFDNMIGRDSKSTGNNIIILLQFWYDNREFHSKSIKIQLFLKAIFRVHILCIMYRLYHNFPMCICFRNKNCLCELRTINSKAVFSIFHNFEVIYYVIL